MKYRTIIVNGIFTKDAPRRLDGERVIHTDTRILGENDPDLFVELKQEVGRYILYASNKIEDTITSFPERAVTVDKEEIRETNNSLIKLNGKYPAQIGKTTSYLYQRDFLLEDSLDLVFYVTVEIFDFEIESELEKALKKAI